LKSGVTGEKKILESLDGLTFFRPEMRHKGFIWSMDQKELSETKEDILNGFSKISRIIENGDFSLAVLDEVLDIVDCGFLSEDSLIKLLDKVPNTEFILTGRKASDLLKEKSDYISHISKVKHPFDLGIQSRKGIEY
jgi:cob(I)alamin adenosyltransferase